MKKHIMEDTSLAVLFAVLSRKKGEEWDNVQSDDYYNVVSTWEDCLALKVSDELYYHYNKPVYPNAPFRPSPSELCQIAARLASPRPEANEVYGEIMHLAEQFGEYGVVERGLRLPGDPPFSHPLIGRVVKLLGGWRRVCYWDEKVEGSLHRRTTEAHKTADALWQREVVTQLREYPEARDPYYFQPPAPSLQVESAREPRKRATGEAERRVPPPQRAIESLKKIGVSL